MLIAAAFFSGSGSGSGSGAPQATVSEECLEVPRDLIDAIEDGLEVGYRGRYRLIHPFAVRSNDFKKLYYISAEVQRPGMEGSGDIGTWASNSLVPGEGMMFSMPDLATKISVWPDGTTTKAQMSRLDHGYAQSHQCVLGFE